MTKKEFNKKILLCIKMCVDRFYMDVDFDGWKEIKKKTMRSLLYEYKTSYPFEDGQIK